MNTEHPCKYLVTSCWAHLHINLATNDDPSCLPIPYIGQSRHINSFVRYKWQALWDAAVNKLHAIQPLWAAGLEAGVKLTERK